jgi:hypothetical protein
MRGHVQMRKKRKVRSVMGWLLRRQLRLPGAGVCCAVSMLAGGVCGSLKGSLGELEGLGDDRVHVAFPARRRVGVTVVELSFPRASYQASPRCHRAGAGTAQLQLYTSYMQSSLHSECRYI